jgi:hypothetical protein
VYAFCQWHSSLIYNYKHETIASAPFGQYAQHIQQIHRHIFASHIHNTQGISTPTTRSCLNAWQMFLSQHIHQMQYLAHKKGKIHGSHIYAYVCK